MDLEQGKTESGSIFDLKPVSENYSNHHILCIGRGLNFKRKSFCLTFKGLCS